MELTKLLRLDRLDKEGRAPIHLRICWQGNKVRLSAGEKVKPADWDLKTEQVRNRAQFAAHINARLRTYETKLHDYFYAREHAKQPVAEADVRTEVERIRVEELGQVAKQTTQTAPPVNLRTFWLQYIADHKGLKSDSYVRHFRPVLDHLVKFRPDIDFKDITLSFANQFVQYLMGQGLSDDSAYTALKKMRAVLKYARRCGIDAPDDYTNFPARSSHIEREFLTRDELTQLEQTVFVDGFFQRQRDVFLFACYTGLRWSDLPQVTPGRLAVVGGDTLLRIVQTKTGKANPIPLSGYALRILKKYPNGLPLVAQQVYNRALKEICRTAGLTRPITQSRYYNGRRIDTARQLWEVISSHTARHTFATQSLKRGMGIVDVQQLLGHGRLDSTMIYSHLLVEDKADAMRRAWGDELPEN